MLIFSVSLCCRMSSRKYLFRFRICNSIRFAVEFPRTLRKNIFRHLCAISIFTKCNNVLSKSVMLFLPFCSFRSFMKYFTTHYGKTILDSLYKFLLVRCPRCQHSL
ncbi:unnamed protein product [Amoebophrya sp. A120]|nr:unnamed protein product [Amoebophrya sp. A120]|eukprot:GSA120T00024113001.1